jgi:hypothetical protein
VSRSKDIVPIKLGIKRETFGTFVVIFVSEERCFGTFVAIFEGVALQRWLRFLVVQMPLIANLLQIFT